MIDRFSLAILLARRNKSKRIAETLLRLLNTENFYLSPDKVAGMQTFTGSSQFVARNSWQKLMVTTGPGPLSTTNRGRASNDGWKRSEPSRHGWLIIIILVVSSIVWPKRHSSTSWYHARNTG